MKAVGSALLGVALSLGAGRAWADERPFDPLRYFAGRTNSVGIVFGADGTLKNRISGTTRGARGRAGETRFDQVIRYDDGKVMRRSWRVVRTGPSSVDATATDIVGTAHGDVSGRTLHLRYVLRTDPANPLFDVDFEQWLTLDGDGRTLVNHAEARKLGILLRRVDERFERRGGT